MSGGEHTAMSKGNHKQGGGGGGGAGTSLPSQDTSPHTCDICREKFPSISSLSSHLIKAACSQSKKTTDSGSKYTCTICCQQFTNGSQFHHHLKTQQCVKSHLLIQTKQNNLPVTNHQTASRSRTEYFCGTCFNIFYDPSELESHIMNKVCQDSVLEEFLCGICKHLFHKQGELESHIREAHCTSSHWNSRPIHASQTSTRQQQGHQVTAPSPQLSVRSLQNQSSNISSAVGKPQPFITQSAIHGQYQKTGKPKILLPSPALHQGQGHFQSFRNSVGPTTSVVNIPSQTEQSCKEKNSQVNIPSQTENIRKINNSQVNIPAQTENFRKENNSQVNIPSQTENFRKINNSHVNIPSQTENFRKENNSQVDMSLWTESSRKEKNSQVNLPSRTEISRNENNSQHHTHVPLLYDKFVTEKCRQEQESQGPTRMPCLSEKNVEKKWLVCRACKASFITHVQFVEHILSRHYTTLNVAPSSSASDYFCGLCNEFKSGTALQEHLNTCLMMTYKRLICSGTEAGKDTGNTSSGLPSSHAPKQEQTTILKAELSTKNPCNRPGSSAENSFVHTTQKFISNLLDDNTRIKVEPGLDGADACRTDTREITPDVPLVEQDLLTSRIHSTESNVEETMSNFVIHGSSACDTVCDVYIDTDIEPTAAGLHFPNGDESQTAFQLPSSGSNYSSYAQLVMEAKQRNVKVSLTQPSKDTLQQYGYKKDSKMDNNCRLSNSDTDFEESKNVGESQCSEKSSSLNDVTKKEKPQSICKSDELDDDIDSGSMHTCTICRQQFTNGSQFHRHLKTRQCVKSHLLIQTKQNNLPVTNHQTASRSRTEYFCGTCFKIFYDPSELESHIMNKVCQDSVLEEFLCGICKHLFHKQGELESHIREAHCTSSSSHWNSRPIHTSQTSTQQQQGHQVTALSPQPSVRSLQNQSSNISAAVGKPQPSITQSAIHGQYPEIGKLLILSPSPALHQGQGQFQSSKISAGPTTYVVSMPSQTEQSCKEKNSQVNLPSRTEISRKEKNSQVNIPSRTEISHKEKNSRHHTHVPLLYDKFVTEKCRQEQKSQGLTQTPCLSEKNVEKKWLVCRACKASFITHVQFVEHILSRHYTTLNVAPSSSASDYFCGLCNEFKSGTALQEHLNTCLMRACKHLICSGTEAGTVAGKDTGNTSSGIPSSHAPQQEQTTIPEAQISTKNPCNRPGSSAENSFVQQKFISNSLDDNTRIKVEPGLDGADACRTDTREITPDVPLVEQDLLTSRIHSTESNVEETMSNSVIHGTSACDTICDVYIDTDIEPTAAGLHFPNGDESQTAFQLPSSGSNYSSYAQLVMEAKQRNVKVSLTQPSKDTLQQYGYKKDSEMDNNCRLSNSDTDFEESKNVGESHCSEKSSSLNDVTIKEEPQSICESDELDDDIDWDVLEAQGMLMDSKDDLQLENLVKKRTGPTPSQPNDNLVKVFVHEDRIVNNVSHYQSSSTADVKTPICKKMSQSTKRLEKDKVVMVETVKKKRGRPPKKKSSNENSVSGVSASAPESQTSSKDSKVVMVETTTKKKRSRPPKKDNLNESSASSASLKDKVTKTRGRKRTKSSEEKAAETSLPGNSRHSTDLHREKFDVPEQLVALFPSHANSVFDTSADMTPIIAIVDCGIDENGQSKTPDLDLDADESDVIPVRKRRRILKITSDDDSDGESNAIKTVEAAADKSRLSKKRSFCSSGKNSEDEDDDVEEEEEEEDFLPTRKRKVLKLSNLDEDEEEIAVGDKNIGGQIQIEGCSQTESTTLPDVSLEKEKGSVSHSGRISAYSLQPTESSSSKNNSRVMKSSNTSSASKASTASCDKLPTKHTTVLTDEPSMRIDIPKKSGISNEPGSPANDTLSKLLKYKPKRAVFSWQK